MNEQHNHLVLTLHTPHATVHSSLVAEAWFAWHSMQRSIMWFRQIAQLSTTISEIKNTWITVIGTVYKIYPMPIKQPHSTKTKNLLNHFNQERLCWTTFLTSNRFFSPFELLEVGISISSESTSIAVAISFDFLLELKNYYQKVKFDFHKIMNSDRNTVRQKKHNDSVTTWQNLFLCYREILYQIAILVGIYRDELWYLFTNVN